MSDAETWRWLNVIDRSPSVLRVEKSRERARDKVVERGCPRWKVGRRYGKWTLFWATFSPHGNPPPYLHQKTLVREDTVQKTKGRGNRDRKWRSPVASREAARSLRSGSTVRSYPIFWVLTLKYGSTLFFVSLALRRLGVLVLWREELRSPRDA